MKCTSCIFLLLSCSILFSTCNLADYDSLSDLFGCFYDLLSNFNLNDLQSFAILFHEPYLPKYWQFERYSIHCKMVLLHMVGYHYSLRYVSSTQDTDKHFVSGLALNKYYSFSTFEIFASLWAFFLYIDFCKRNHYFSIILLYSEFY